MAQNTSMTLTRNPNLTVVRSQAASSKTNEVQKNFGERWWTGLPPEKCPGFDRERQCLVALPLLNLKICTRQDVLDYFNNTWTLTELLFAGLKNEEVYVRPPYHQLRHPMIFYYGHTAVLFINKLRLAGLQKGALNLYLEKVLETGVDEMSWDDMSKNEMAWPSVEAVHAYRKTTYEIIKDVILTHPDLEPGTSRDLLLHSPLWALWMGFEHEKIHFETSSVLIRELPIEFVETPKYWAPLHPSLPAQDHFHPRVGADFEPTHWMPRGGGLIQVGKKQETESYGWDNEYGSREIQIKDFQYTQTQITNGEYYEFVAGGAYGRDEYWSPEGLEWRKFRNTKRPTFWAAVGPEGSHEYQLRTIFEFIPMPWRWPVEVNFHEAQAYCRWKNQKDKTPLHYRLLSEAEYVSLRREERDSVLQKKRFSDYEKFNDFKENFNFIWSSASAVGSEIGGNVWHWLEDQFNPLPGFEVHRLYDDFSTPCFDGQHQMILGGSFISCGHEASQWARFHFRPHFYQHSGFRMAATLDGSRDNGAVKLKTAEQYVHPHRQNTLDQLQKPNWWQKVEQPLELNNEEMKRIFATTEEALLKFNQQYPEMSPMGTAHDPSRNSVPPEFTLPYQATKNFPADPEPYEKLLQFIFKEMAPLSQLPGHPGYAAYVAGSGNMISNVAQMVSQTLNPFSSHYMMAPGLVTLEAEAIGWFIRLMNLPEKTAGGLFTTGSSLASLSALTMARQKKIKGHDLSKVTLYVSDQSHHCLSKAWVTLGFAGENIRFIPTSRPDFRMQVGALEKAVQQDKARGFIPLCVVGNAGTTNTGAVDDLKSIAALARREDLWFHVDGAYGALFLLTDKAKETLAGLDQADSLVFDLHKALALSYGTGCLLVRNKEDMRFSYPGAKSYMPPEIEESEYNLRVDYADISPELSRDYRGLRVWLPIKTWGMGPFILNLEEKLALSEWLAKELQALPQLEMIAAPQLSIQAFTVKAFASREENNQATQKLLEKINKQGTLFVSGCTIDGRKSIRICLLGFRMHYPRLQKALHEIKTWVSELKDSP